MIPVQWYLAQAKPRQESVAERHLAEQGFATYCPMIQVPRRRRGRWVDVIEPLFPRYVFVGVVAGVQAIAPVRSTPGVSAIVRFGVEYAEVPTALIAELRAREYAGLHRLRLPQELRSGDPIRVQEGVFAGLLGLFVQSHGRDRVIVLLEILGQSSRMTLPRVYVAG